MWGGRGGPTLILASTEQKWSSPVHLVLVYVVHELCVVSIVKQCYGRQGSCAGGTSVSHEEVPIMSGITACILVLDNCGLFIYMYSSLVRILVLEY